MSWLKIDDGFAEHPKMDNIGDRSFRLHVAALCYCSRNLTDGLVSPKAVKVLAAVILAARVSRNLEELVNAGLWLDNNDGSYSIYSYLEHNPPAEEVKQRRAEISAKRSEAGKRGAEARWQNMANGMATGMANVNGNAEMAPSHPIPSKEQEPDGEQDSVTNGLHALRLFNACRSRHQSDLLKAACLAAARDGLPASDFEGIREYMVANQGQIKHDGKYVTTSLKNARARRAA